MSAKEITQLSVVLHCHMLQLETIATNQTKSQLLACDWLFITSAMFLTSLLGRGDSPYFVSEIFTHVLFNPFTAETAKSKVDKFPKITSWVKVRNNQLQSELLLFHECLTIL